MLVMGSEGDGTRAADRARRATSSCACLRRARSGRSTSRRPTTALAYEWLRRDARGRPRCAERCSSTATTSSARRRRTGSSPSATSTARGRRSSRTSPPSPQASGTRPSSSTAAATRSSTGEPHETSRHHRRVLALRHGRRHRHRGARSRTRGTAATTSRSSRATRRPSGRFSGGGVVRRSSAEFARELRADEAEWREHIPCGETPQSRVEDRIDSDVAERALRAGRGGLEQQRSVAMPRPHAASRRAYPTVGSSLTARPR